MKVCLVTPKVEVPSQHLENADEALETRLNKKTGRCRKLSEDLSFFKKARQIKEIYIAESFFDLFNVEEKLGEGAQSVVKKCTELASGNIFAVKLFRSCDCELIEMLKAQYKILTELSHPNIIEGYYLFVNEKSMSCQMVLEYCSFPSLSEVIAQEPLTTQ
jgi:serine/threonine protein kinase